MNEPLPGLVTALPAATLASAQPPRSKPKLVVTNERQQRTLYVRHYPKTVFFLEASLTKAQCWAYVRLCHMVAVNNGEAPDDDKKLAEFAGLPLPKWRELRAKLQVLGIAGGENGRWIDPDQQKSFDMQRSATDRASKAGQARWEKRRREKLDREG